MKPHPWFNPPIRRVLVTGLCIGWILLELTLAPGSFWLYVALATFAYAIWDFYLAGHYPVAEPDAGGSGQNG